jgi:GATA-binding protein
MKKQEIKRRKRVIPANDAGSQVASSVADFSPPQRALETPALDQSASPEPPIESREVYTPEPKGPLAIDFTHYYGSNTAATSRPHNVPTPSNAQPNAPSPRKRSRSVTSMDIDREEAPAQPAHPVPHRPNAISSILNPHTEESNIDPSLAAVPRTSGGPSPNPATSQEDKAARRERLKREAEAMRQELERRQKELDDLEND